VKSKSATQCIRPHLSCISAELAARSGWSMALRQNDRPQIHRQQQWPVVSRHARYPARSPCSRDSVRTGRVAPSVLRADWRSSWLMAEDGVLSMRYHLLAICIEHTKESSSHRHKDRQIDDWGLLGAERSRGFPRSIYWTSAGKRSASLAADCDSNHILEEKSAMVLSRGLHSSMRVNAEEALESQPMVPTPPKLCRLGAVAW
jgi:hypothetical protein